MTIYFVGMHNKPGKGPLDSSTRSGRIVDLLIEGMQLPAVKTNIFECDYFPDDDQACEAAKGWHTKYKPQAGDIVVLLGSWVHNHFIVKGFLNQGVHVLKLTHPASTIYSGKKEAVYLSDAIIRLTDLKVKYGNITEETGGAAT